MSLFVSFLSFCQGKTGEMGASGPPGPPGPEVGHAYDKFATNNLHKGTQAI